MAGVNEAIVREFFEAHGLLVRQQRKFVAPSAAEDEQVDFVVWNPRAPSETRALPFVLAAGDVDRLRLAAVSVKGWHTNTMSAALLASDPEVARFTDPALLERAARSLGLEPPLTCVLIVPWLPQTRAGREEAQAALRARGVDAVLSFREVLGDLIVRTQPNRNYARSDVLQMLRILKNYELLKDPSLELFRPGRRRK